jgi:hypothetical protein
MNWKNIAISSIPFSRWYNHMWIMSISLLFLSTPQVFPKFILFSFLSKPEYPVLQTGLSDFGHWICPASTPDSSKFFWTCPVIYPDMSGLSAKNLKLNQNLLFWFISSTHLNLCDHVKILWWLKGKGGMVEEVFIMDYLSVWSWAKLLPIAEKEEALK